jgi:DNA repair exonuclease SbcCD ATPase subunit
MIPMENEELDEDLNEDIADGNSEKEVIESTPEELAAQKELEDEARKYGWRPKEEFTNDPEGWVDASRFMEFPSTNVKVLRDTRKDLEQQLARERQDREETFGRIDKANKAAMERVREQERARAAEQIALVQAEKLKAAGEQDLEKYHQLDSQEMQLRQAAYREQAKPQDQPPAVDPKVKEYSDAHEWTKNPLIWDEARRSIDLAMESGRSFNDVDEQIQYADSVIKQKYPHLFAPKSAPASRVEGRSLATGARRGKGADDLPPEARQAAKDLVDEGIYKNTAEYAKDYWAQET